MVLFQSIVSPALNPSRINVTCDYEMTEFQMFGVCVACEVGPFQGSLLIGI